ncbi:MAG: trypsin-like peptidase domain-containing protein [Oscillospiraceae bacterium]|nr:trypsin-like peptidase domain-containing protein [Oscillospiraceae bacterium]
MDERNYDHPWDDSVYGTGRTEPPKSRGGIIALLLILVIFLCGIITVLGILNIKLFNQLNTLEEEGLSIAYIENEPENTDGLMSLSDTVPTTVPTEPGGAYPSIDLQPSPKSEDNIPQEGGKPLQDIYEDNIRSVVSISCRLTGGSTAGTGVILSRNGYIVTNAHVVDGAAEVSVRLTDDREFPAQIVGADEISDLAVLLIQAEDLSPAQFGDSGSLRVGDSVTAIGDPLGVEFRGTYTNGIVSAINRDVTVDGRTMTLIQTNAALNSGNSGGPLINCYGQVIGINTMKIGAFTDSAGVEGLGFAIPSVTVKDIVEQIIAQGYVSGRPTLGIEGESLDTFYQYYYRMPAGLFITGVDRGSYAERSGIEEGDILIYVDDIRITSLDELNRAIYAHEVGDTVTVTIYRGGKTASVELILTEDKG